MPLAPRLLLVLSLATLPMCDSEATQLAQQITDAKGDCDAQGLKSTDEACVQMMQRYAEIGTEAIRTYIGAVKSLDLALQRMPPAEFDTAGLGHALTPGVLYGADSTGGDALGPGAPSADYLPLQGGLRFGGQPGYSTWRDGGVGGYSSAPGAARSYDPRGYGPGGYGPGGYGAGYADRGYGVPGYGSGYPERRGGARGYDPRSPGAAGYGAYGRRGYDPRAYPGYGGGYGSGYGAYGYGVPGGRAYGPRGYGAPYADPRWSQGGYVGGGDAYPGGYDPRYGSGYDGYDGYDGGYDDGSAYEEAPRTGTAGGGAARPVPPGPGLLLPPEERLDRPWLHGGGGAAYDRRYRAAYPDAYLAPSSRDTLPDAGRTRRPTRPPDRN